jgi:hypothetical protein
MNLPVVEALQPPELSQVPDRTCKRNTVMRIACPVSGSRLLRYGKHSTHRVRDAILFCPALDKLINITPEHKEQDNA